MPLQICIFDDHSTNIISRRSHYGELTLTSRDRFLVLKLIEPTVLGNTNIANTNIDSVNRRQGY